MGLYAILHVKCVTFCVDIYECTVGENRCHDNAVCSNLLGSYDCTCESGFTGDGFSCVGELAILRHKHYIAIFYHRSTERCVCNFTVKCVNRSYSV